MYDALEPIKNRVQELGKQIACVILDSTFLSIWVLVQYIVNHLIIDKYELSSILNKWVLMAFELIFALSTLLPIIIYTYLDIVIIIKRARRYFNEELNK